MPKAIDFHVHLPTTEFMQVTLDPYVRRLNAIFVLKSSSKISNSSRQTTRLWICSASLALPHVNGTEAGHVDRRQVVEGLPTRRC